MPLFPGSAKLCGHGAYIDQEPIISQTQTHPASFALRSTRFPSRYAGRGNATPSDGPQKNV